MSLRYPQPSKPSPPTRWPPYRLLLRWIAYLNQRTCWMRQPIRSMVRILVHPRACGEPAFLQWLQAYGLVARLKDCGFVHALPVVFNQPHFIFCPSPEFFNRHAAGLPARRTGHAIEMHPVLASVGIGLDGHHHAHAPGAAIGAVAVIAGLF